MRHIRTLANGAPALERFDPVFVLETIALLAVDSLAGASETTATVDEAMAI